MIPSPGVRLTQKPDQIAIDCRSGAESCERIDFGAAVPRRPFIANTRYCLFQRGDISPGHVSPNEIPGGSAFGDDAAYIYSRQPQQAVGVLHLHPEPLMSALLTLHQIIVTPNSEGWHLFVDGSFVLWTKKKDEALDRAHQLGKAFHTQGYDCEILVREAWNDWSEVDL